MESPQKSSLDVDSALTCSRQRYLFRGIRRQHQTLRNLALLDTKDKRIAQLRDQLDVAEQDLFNLRHTLREEGQGPDWQTWAPVEKPWHRPFVQPRTSEASLDYTMASPAKRSVRSRSESPAPSPAKRAWTPRGSPLKQQKQQQQQHQLDDPFATPQSIIPNSPTLLGATAMRDPFDHPPPKLVLPSVTAALLVSTPVVASATKLKRSSLLHDSKQRLKRVLRFKTAAAVVPAASLKAAE